MPRRIEITIKSIAIVNNIVWLGFISSSRADTVRSLAGNV